MSSAVAAARKRRAGIQPPVNTPPPGMDMGRPQPGGAPPQGGLTLQQVINVINGRLLALENSEKERREAQSAGAGVGASVSPQLSSMTGIQNQEPLQEGEVELPIGEILSEYESRFEFLTEELSNIKEIVLKLQSYTMDVNRVLLEERIPSTFVSDVSDASGVNTETVDNITLAAPAESLTIQTENLSPLVAEAPVPPLAPVAAVVSQPHPTPHTGKSGKKSVSIAGI
jgi:hypothetical protein